MPAPHFPLLHAIKTPKAKYKGCLWFKWQWALFYEEKSYMQGGWKNRMMVFDSRADARLWKSNLNGQIKLRNASVRNVKMKRRLVQANWDDYNDSFSYNAKGNGNGQ